MIRKLPTRFVDKVWGVKRLPAPFPHPSDQPIGEVWFEPPPELDQLLVKYIFTSERLSVQAHPSDEQAEAMGLADGGKSECWVILDAEPGASIAVGFREDITAEDMRRSALDGTIVDKLVWHEVQQNSDITFRLFDYGRPRELHLDQGVEVATTGPYPLDLSTRMDDDAGLLVDGPHFRLFYWQSNTSAPLPAIAQAPSIVIPLSGEIMLDGQRLGAGECALVEDLGSTSRAGNSLLLIAQPTASS
jgi:mannose-6-phosphate isomerase